ncbi:hypothetical protein K8P10_002215 [Leucobacter sp. Psy1]|uniref:hypothetical protein n=1 Tax=Leucobacter sp. Psy1 TaxID=2875729 RepID=UPI001CD2D790|nr:hypothetical protein [Leucobacter sp. Psy1]UBH06704.1 hypothetical protein K8P10_002215 [Leucobacter sp. Psy1]
MNVLYSAPLLAVTSVLVAAEDTEFDPDRVTPGTAGFIATGVFALAVILLGVDLGRRLRRTKYRAEIREQLEREMAENAENEERAAEDHPRTSTEDPRGPRD